MVDSPSIKTLAEHEKIDASCAAKFLRSVLPVPNINALAICGIVRRVNHEQGMCQTEKKIAQGNQKAS